MSSGRVLRRALAVVLTTAAMLLFGCGNEESRMRKRIAGEYVADIDEVYLGTKRREHHVLTITADGMWTRTGWQESDGKRRDLFRDSGHYRIQDRMLVLRSHVEEVGPIRFTIIGEILHGGNAPISYMTMQAGISEGRFIRVRR